MNEKSQGWAREQNALSPPKSAPNRMGQGKKGVSLFWSVIGSLLCTNAKAARLVVIGETTGFNYAHNSTPNSRCQATQFIFLPSVLWVGNMRQQEAGKHLEFP